MTVNNEMAFREWFKTQTHNGGTPYAENTKKNYITALSNVVKKLMNEISPYQSMFEIDSVEELDRVRKIIEESKYAHEILSYSNYAGRASLDRYREFLIDKFQKNKDEFVNKGGKEICYNTNVPIVYPLNRIVFGAPGTGKSNLLNNEQNKLLGDDNKSWERVTFHPDYTYANFVGTYKPVPTKDNNGAELITYKYVPGPFTRMLVKALSDAEHAHLLIVEEINRANVAAVFGDVFQLLDRNKNGVSEYKIQTSEDMRNYLAEELDVDISKVANIQLPNNLYIWATMNSADQGVYPMDTAFKRRWDFEYIDIDNNDKKISHFWFNVAGKQYHWNSLRKAINDQLTEIGVNEDKLMGAFFVSKHIIDSGDNEKFVKAFCNKVIMYLFEDAARQKHSKIFDLGNGKVRYSKLCADFNKKGIGVFVASIIEKYDVFVKGVEPPVATQAVEPTEPAAE